MDIELDENVAIILRQTDLTEDDVKKRLESHNGDYVKVLEEYYGIKKIVKTPSTINQLIYKEIRTVMDDAAFRFYNARENSKETKE